MSNRLVKAYNHGNGSSGTSSYSYQTCWMSRWTQAPSKHGSLVAPHSQSFSKEEVLDHRQKRLRRTLDISSDVPRSFEVRRNITEADTVRLANRCPTIRAQNFRKRRSDPGCSNEANSPTARKCNPLSLLLFTADERADSDLQPQSNLKASGNFPTLRLSSGRKGLAVSKTSQDNLAGLTSAMPHASVDADNHSKIMIFGRHFADNGFTRMDQGSSKYEKYSAILVCKRGKNSELFASQGDPPSSCHECQPLEGLPCSVRNVDTMKICTAVDFVGNSHKSPLFSHTKTHHFSFTKQTGANLSEGHPIVQEPNQSTQHRGVEIQPLWSSTDSEKDNIGDAGISKDNMSHEISAETDTMDLVAPSNKNDCSGVLLPPIVKSQHTTRDKTLLMAGVDPREDKAKGKMPVTEIHDTNSMDGMEPSTSRTQSLDVEHLLSCAEQPSGSKSKEYSFPEPSSRWVKCLKMNSSEVGESSSHEKTHMFFSKFTKLSRTSSDPSMEKHQSKELSVTDQNARLTMKCVSSSRKSKDTVFQCFWIQRWCQDHTMAVQGHPRKGFVICEPGSSKLPFDELEKQQFPSIAAMALTGKSMDGFRPCKFMRRGPFVVWNTEEY